MTYLAGIFGRWVKYERLFNHIICIQKLIPRIALISFSFLLYRSTISPRESALLLDKLLCRFRYATTHVRETSLPKNENAPNDLRMTEHLTVKGTLHAVNNYPPPPRPAFCLSVLLLALFKTFKYNFS